MTRKLESEDVEVVEYEEELIEEYELDDEYEDDEDFDEEADIEDEEYDEEYDEYDLGITKEGIAEATDDFNTIYKEGVATAKELKDAFDDIKDAFNLGSFFK